MGGIMSATDELRRMLDERGVEHYDGSERTLWGYEPTGEDTGIYRFAASEISGGFLQFDMFRVTPEQAIVATLGGGECEFRPFEDEDWSEPNAVRGVCSECSALMHGKDNYCPNCGKRVRKKVDE